jgi:hypothetical protein
MRFTRTANAMPTGPCQPPYPATSFPGHGKHKIKSEIVSLKDFALHYINGV